MHASLESNGICGYLGRNFNVFAKLAYRPAVLTIGLVMPMASFSAEGSLQPGSYACIAQRAEGIQSKADTDKRTWGRIAVAPERFLVKTAKISEDQRRWCSSASVGQPGIEDHRRLRWECKTGYELTFSQGKYSLPLRGDNLHTFHGSAYGTFHMTVTLTYVFVLADYDVGNFYLEEGVCQKLEDERSVALLRPHVRRMPVGIDVAWSARSSPLCRRSSCLLIGPGP